MFPRAVTTALAVSMTCLAAACALPVASPGPPPAVAPAPSASAAVQTGANDVATLRSADAAYARGDAGAAADLYAQAANAGDSPAESPSLAAAVSGYARFRAILALIASGEEQGAAGAVQQVRADDPTDPFTPLVSELWEQYSTTADLAGACAAIAPTIPSQVGPALGELQNTDAAIGTASLCTLPGS